MNFSNIWNHPKTTVAGLLIAVASVAGVLSQQGITLGKAGTGTIVTLVSALATALLGLFAKDPEAASEPGSKSGSQQAKLGAWAMIALLIPLPWMQGCTKAGVAQDIVNWTPALQSAVATVDSTAALLVPVDAPIFITATVGFDAATNLLVAQAKAYLANPSGSLLEELQDQIVTLQQQVNASLLQAAKIVDPASQAHALNVIQGVATIVNTLLSLVASVSSKAQVAAMSSHVTVTMAAVARFENPERDAAIVAAHYGEPAMLAEMQVASGRAALAQAGF